MPSTSTTEAATLPCPGGPPDQPEILVLLCTDTGTGSRGHGGQLATTRHDLAGAVRSGLGETSTRVVIGSGRVCAQPSRLVETMKMIGTRRAVVGCRHLGEKREHMLAGLREAGARRAGVRLIDLEPASRADPARVTWQSVARIVAAVAGVAEADLDVPDRERVVAGPMSRRSLFRPAGLERHPIASWLAGRCDGGTSCAACALACPRGAVRLSPSGPVIDEATCTGCGACVSACGAAAMALPGWSLGQLEAETRSLAIQALHADRSLIAGLALTCAQAVPGHRPGSDWLPVEVPSLEMVTADWLLALARTGVTVAITPCEDEPCSKRALDLSGIGALAGRSTPMPAHSLSLRSAEADGTPRRCASCGQPLGAGLTDIVGQRLAVSHPRIADRLARQDRCADCLLLSGLGNGALPREEAARRGSA